MISRTVLFLTSCSTISSTQFLARSHTNFSISNRNPSNRTSVKRIIPRSILSPVQQKIATAVSLPALPIVAYSEYVLLSTGCGLPPGPYGLLGAAEGISYLVIAALVILSIYSKVKTGSGLPEGPAKLLGAAEGVAFLLVFAGIGIAAFTVYKYGDLPSGIPTPGSRCFPTEQ